MTWEETSARQRVVDGRLASVGTRYRWVNGGWVETSGTRYRTQIAATPPPPPPGADVLPPAPAGYQTWYETDFRNGGSTLPAGWEAQASGTTNSGAVYRTENVAMVPGTGLVHTAERASVGAPIYSGKVFARLGMPQFHHIRFSARCEGFAEGIWPSFWARPQAGGAMQGEKDWLEGFGGHIDGSYPRVWGGGYIATSPSPYSLGKDTVDFALPSTTWDQSHVYESRQVPGMVTMWADGQQKGFLNAAGMSTAEARSAWAAQFDDPAATWYLRTDFQISYTSTSQAGYSNAGALSSSQVGTFARWIIEWVQIFTPTS